MYGSFKSEIKLKTQAQIPSIAIIAKTLFTSNFMIATFHKIIPYKLLSRILDFLHFHNGAYLAPINTEST